jgi:cell division protein ZapA (FtsZ GTPase activity inhibitor)
MRIDLLGAQFNIKTDQDPDYLSEVVELYRKKVGEVQSTVSTSDSLKIAILAGLLTADEYMKSTGELRSTTTEAERIAGSLIRELDEVLADDGPPDSYPV